MNISKESKAKYFPVKQIHTGTRNAPASDTEISFQEWSFNILGEYNNVLEENDNLFEHDRM